MQTFTLWKYRSDQLILRPHLEIRIRVRDSYLGLGIQIWGYDRYIQVLGFRVRYKSALHLLHTVKKGVIAGFSSVMTSKIVIFPLVYVYT